MPILESRESSFSDVDHVGVVIRDTGHGMHAGLLYHFEGGPARILHLAFHHMLRDEVADSPYRWANLGMDEDNKIVFAIQLSRIAGVMPRISYGFDSSGIIFDAQTGELIPAPAGKGLTCATFIIAVLKTYGHDLVDVKTWPDRTDDRAWEQTILDLLAQHASSEHVEAVRKDAGAKRFRPDEVVGAASASDGDWPIIFADARGLADQICEDLAA